MTQIEPPKVVKKKLFSPVWLLPIVALALGAWLGIKSIKESGIEVRVHFPSATGIDIGKTLVRYQGLTVGKVVDIGIDEELSGVNVDILMDYRSEPFLNRNTKFWLVTPKASITGVEGLEALFSGNYIGVQPGDGEPRYVFEAERNAPPIQPGSEGVMVTLMTDKLASLDVGSPVFYRQIPVGDVVSYRLDDSDKVHIDAFIQEQYAHLVKQNSNFWNVSGINIDASLSGVKINSESLAAVLAGGIAFDSPANGVNAVNGDSFNLYANEESALGGVIFKLATTKAEGINLGTQIQYRGIEIGRVLSQELTDTGVSFTAKLDANYTHLLTGSAQFWQSGAQVSLDGVKHVGRLLTGDVINFMPGRGAPKASYSLNDKAPELVTQPKLKLTLIADNNPGISENSEIRYKQFPIGKVIDARLSNTLTHIEYDVEILPEFSQLMTQGSYFIAESALSVEASLSGVSIQTRDLNTLVKGALSLVTSDNRTPVDEQSSPRVFANAKQADDYFTKQQQIKVSLISNTGADLNLGSPVFYKKMQIGQIEAVEWQQQQDNFAISLNIDKKYRSLIKDNTVYWQNAALNIDASLAGVKVSVPPLEGILQGSISLGLLKNNKKANSNHLYQSQILAMAQATPISLTLTSHSQLAANAAIRYKEHQVGMVQSVRLSKDLNSIEANAYLYGDYAEHFVKSDSQYAVVQADISLAGIEAPTTLLTGPYIEVSPGTSQQTSTHFMVSNLPTAEVNAEALVFKLEDMQLGSLKRGTGIFFRGIKIGQVDNYQLSEQGNSVILSAHIDKQYKHLVNTSSKFWHLSGIKMDLGLFSGAQIETGSLETILAGGIGVVTEKVTNKENALLENQIMVLHNKPQVQWHSWAPKQTPITQFK